MVSSIVQLNKKILRFDSEFWGQVIFKPKMIHLHQKENFLEKSIQFPCTSWPLCSCYRWKWSDFTLKILLFFSLMSSASLFRLEHFVGPICSFHWCLTFDKKSKSDIMKFMILKICIWLISEKLEMPKCKGCVCYISLFFLFSHIKDALFWGC